jgi:putative ABC transport system permease protein
LKYLPLLWAGLWRRPARTVFTLLSISIAFVLVGLLQGVTVGFDEAIAAARRDLMTVNARVRGSPPMPIAMMEEIANVPGVAEVVPRAYFVGAHRPPYDVVAIATLPDRFFALRPGLAAEADGVKAMASVRNGMLATPALLTFNEWKVGDTITLRSRELKTDGSGDWSFQIVGTFDSVKNPNTSALGVINYAYLDDYRVANRGTAELFYIRIEEAKRSVATAAAIDAAFVNSAYATRTQSDQERAEANTRQMGDIAFLTNSVLAAVLFTLLFLTGNTMRQSVQDRVSEFGLLKAVGYSDSRVSGLALTEALVLYLGGACLGLAVAAALAPLAKELSQSLTVSATVFTRAMVLAICFALVSVALPSWRLYRLAVADSLAGR